MLRFPTIDFDPSDVLPVEKFTPGTAEALLERFAEADHIQQQTQFFGDDPQAPELVAVGVELFDVWADRAEEVAPLADPEKVFAVTPGTFTDGNFKNYWTEGHSSYKTDADNHALNGALLRVAGKHELQDFQPQTARKLLTGDGDPGWEQFGVRVFYVEKQPRLMLMHVHQWQVIFFLAIMWHLYVRERGRVKVVNWHDFTGIPHQCRDVLRNDDPQLTTEEYAQRLDADPNFAALDLDPVLKNDFRDRLAARGFDSIEALVQKLAFCDEYWKWEAVPDPAPEESPHSRVAEQNVKRLWVDAADEH